MYIREKIDKKLDYKLIVAAVLCSFAYSVILQFTAFRSVDIGGFKPRNMAEEVLIVLMIGPLAETLLFQALPYYLLNIFREYLNKWFKYAYMLCSTLLFAGAHSYSIGYIVYMILPGLLLSYVFFITKQKMKRAFTTTILIHFFFNGLAIIWNSFMR